MPLGINPINKRVRVEYTVRNNCQVTVESVLETNVRFLYLYNLNNKMVNYNDKIICNKNICRLIFFMTSMYC